MKSIHAPRVDARYWTAITLASVFGTNMGDFYAHESGLGIVKGLGVLALLTAIVFAVERFENLRHQAYYWLVIIIIRTGATNIADYMAYRMKVPEPWLSLGWVAVIAVFGFFTHSALSRGDKSESALPSTNAAYWLAMLGCGVFGTVDGDVCEHLMGENTALIVLTILLAVVLAATHKRATQIIALYWITVAVARTTGTAIGDWLADQKYFHLGLSYSTLIAGLAFVGVLVFWRSQPKTAEPVLESSQA